MGVIHADILGHAQSDVDPIAYFRGAPSCDESDCVSKNYPAAAAGWCETVATMNKKLAMLAFLVGTAVMVNPTTKAFDFSINIGDRAFFEGPSYWDSGYEWVWVPGHREHDHWVHGRYERRGEFHREHEHEHHHHHDHDHDHDHDR